MVCRVMRAMHPLNWLVVVGWLAYVAIDGLRRTRGTKHIEGYFLANRSLPWWAVGLSVMATQLSAVTMIGTTGQGAVDGMRFVQFYFGLPIAMVLLGVTIVPFLHRAKVYTAYEFLERRFDAKTRSLTAFLFLMSRGMSCGTILAAPAVVFSAMFGWPLGWCVLLMGVPTVLYTMIGGVQAVTWADVKQMALIVVAITAVVTVLLLRIPVSPSDALHLAGAAGRLRVFDFSFSLSNTYTFWSGVIGGTFLMLSYFGTDQSQVQRYLTARNVNEARSSLLISAYWKIPLQSLILLIGVLVFVFYQFETPPMLYNPVQARQLQDAQPLALATLQARYDTAIAARGVAVRGYLSARHAGGAVATSASTEFRQRDSAVTGVRAEALALVEKITGQPSRDVNYIIPRFVVEQLPIGLAGLFIAGVMAAAMSAIAAELNSLATATVIDFYRRWYRPEGSDAHFLAVSKGATVFWGIFACVVASYAATLGSLIEVVNRFGSFFYGSILGVFILAMIPRARATGAFVGLIAGMLAVAAVNFGAPQVSFLWHNVVGAVTVVVVGLLVAAASGRPHLPQPSESPG
ncbi:MAG: Na+/solute symporter [Gemmatimonadetes bacterium]|jgi:SSS family solute:Na+ symporter|nr:Na+/solute symporter [Gemmatimonadota bacterium]